MKEYIEIRCNPVVYFRIACAFLIGATWLTVLAPVIAAEKGSLADHAPPSVTDQSASDNITAIQAELLRIENRLRQSEGTNTSFPRKGADKDSGSKKPGQIVEKSMSMPKNKGKMNMKEGMSMEKGMSMENMKPQGMMKSEHHSTSSAMGEMQMMSMMGKRPGAAEKMSTTSLPGYDNAAHLYHLGEQNFFLNYADNIGLNTQQRDQLTIIKQQWQTQSQNMKDKIDALEERLWQQTAVGIPNWQDVSKTIRDTESQRGDMRLAFIQTVGKAVKILSKDQVDRLITFYPQSAQ